MVRYVQKNHMRASPFYQAGRSRLGSQPLSHLMLLSEHCWQILDSKSIEGRKEGEKERKKHGPYSQDIHNGLKKKDREIWWGCNMRWVIARQHTVLRWLSGRHGTQDHLHHWICQWPSQHVTPRANATFQCGGQESLEMNNFVAYIFLYIVSWALKF